MVVADALFPGGFAARHEKTPDRKADEGNVGAGMSNAGAHRVRR